MSSYVQPRRSIYIKNVNNQSKVVSKKKFYYPVATL